MAIRQVNDKPYVVPNCPTDTGSYRTGMQTGRDDECRMARFQSGGFKNPECSIDEFGLAGSLRQIVYRGVIS
jgi:hypothetical protein